MTAARSPARYGRWALHANLDGWPSGDDRPERQAGPIGQRDLGAEDLVRGLRIDAR